MSFFNGLAVAINQIIIFAAGKNGSQMGLGAVGIIAALFWWAA